MSRLPTSIALTFLCLAMFLSARPAAASTTAMPSCEQVQRALIEDVITNKLSSDECRAVVESQTKNQPLQGACSTLISYESAIVLIGCTNDDYDTLHKVICDFNSTDTETSCIATTAQSTTAILTATAVASTAIIDEQKQRDLILCVIENQLSNNTCKSFAKNYSNNDQDLPEACISLEKDKNMTLLDGCSADDYDRLHKVVCEYNSTDTDTISCTAATSTTKAETTTTSSVAAPMAGDQKQRAFIDCVIENQLSSEQCKVTVKAANNDPNQDLQQACTLLESLKDMVSAFGCTTDDYDKLHTAICGYLTKTDEEKQRALIECVIDNELSSAMCTQVVKAANNDPTRDLQEACLLLESLEGSVSTFNCTTEDYDKLHRAICWDMPVDPDSRQGRVEASIKVLSETCQRTMGSGIQELSEPSEKSCKILEDRKDHLISSGACTERDYVRLYLVVCSDRDSEGDQQIEKVVSFLSNNLTASCHDHLWPKVESLAQGLESMCEYLKTTGPILLRVGDCSKTEHNRLDSLLCPRPMSEQEKAQRDEIDRVVAEDVTPSCKSTMEGQIESQRNQPLEESCDLIKGSKDLLSSFCTPEDIVKLESAICGDDGDSASALTGSLLAIVPLFVMSWVSTYVLM